MSRKRTIDYFFKPVHDPQVHFVADYMGEVEDEPIYVEHEEIREVEEEPINTEPEEIGMSSLREVKLDSLIRDPEERPSILSYPINQRDEIRRLYIKLGPCQLEKSKYPSRLCGPNSYMRSFQQVWFKNFWWLEYFEKKDAAFCFPCYLFNKKPIGKVGSIYYPADFTEHEKKDLLELELQHYELDVRNHPHLKNCSTLQELCIGLHEVGKSSTYPLLDRLIRLILTLPVSTATSERAFSTMKIVKTRLRNTMSDDFLRSCLLVNIKREIADTFSTDKIIDDFYLKKQRRAQLKVRKVNG